MAGKTHCFIPMLGKRLRITPLTDCGALPESAQTIVTDGFITVNLSSEVEEGTEILVKNASGNLCVNEKQSDSFKRFNVEIEFCGVNPSLVSMVTNAETYNDYADDVAGFTVPEGAFSGAFALELWTGMSGQACAPGQTGEASGYLVLPLVSAGVLGDLTVDGENAVTFSLSGAYTKGNNSWGRGCYKVVKMTDGTDAVLPTALDPFDHLLLIDTAMAPPPVACDPTAVVAAEIPADPIP